VDLPQIISVAQFDPGPPGKTYTQIFHETMGPAATPDDGFDAAMADLAAVSNAFGAEVQSSPLIVDPGAIGGALGAIDPVNLDAHMAGYVGAMDAGNAILVAAGVTVPPRLLQLPITASYPGLPFLAPIIMEHDFGTVKLGSANQFFFIGTTTERVNLPLEGISFIGFANADAGMWSVDAPTHENLAGDVRTTYTLVMVPAIVGDFIAQVNWISADNRYVYLTVKVSVTF
jgi:hypothetical protein